MATDDINQAARLLALHSAKLGFPGPERDPEAEDKAAKDLLGTLEAALEQSAPYGWRLERRDGAYLIFGYESPEAQRARVVRGEEVRCPDVTLTYADGSFFVMRRNAHEPTKVDDLSFDRCTKVYGVPQQDGTIQSALIGLINEITRGSFYIS